jgi:peptidoglycan-associated lipoprotein
METFAIATFPIALAVGCSATSEKTPSINMQDEVVMQQDANISANDLNSLAYIETEKSIVTTENTVSETQSEDAQAEMTSMETVEAIDSTMHSESTGQDTQMMPVNLQVPEPGKLEPPQTAIFHFAFNKYDVGEQDHALLKAHAEYLLENPHMVVNVNGYSDNRGSAKNNVEVSKKRAQQVADILISNGVPKSQINVNGYGESFPLNDENNWDENRRVELQYSEDPEANGLIVSAF